MPARLALDHKLHDRKWYTPDGYRRDVLGLVRFKKRWVTPADKTKLEAGLVEVDGRWVIPKDETATPARPKAAKKPKRPKASPKARKPARSGRGAKFRAMSFNIRYDWGAPSGATNAWNSTSGNHRRDLALSVIDDYGPDILGVQEALNNQVGDLRNALPEHDF